MSQLTVARPAPLPSGTSRTRPRRDLRVVDATGAADGGWFRWLCGGLLVAGLLAVLLLNTALVQGSFRHNELEARSAELSDRQEALTQEIDEQSAPARLAERAHGMGMVPATSTAYIRLSDHSVVGVAKASTDDRRFSVVTKPGSSSPDAR
ncbi:FtsB/FtsL family cell division protein [Janibacter massiliensis]|uniref:hypothetical protein n=1 Tax=Janibacter massiliensis TaxID=2058291 RepID=UPI000D10B2D0|nr:hypothetical protein [Janibacter massiliensis]